MVESARLKVGFLMPFMLNLGRAPERKVMTSQVSQETALALERWLRRVGFSEGNPFGVSQAERECFVSECFVDPGVYNTVKNDPRAVLVFAPRGGGKSALRVMLASECRPFQSPDSNPRSRDLAVTYADFDPVLQACNHDVTRLTVHHHVTEILSVACTTLLDALWQDPALCTALSPQNRSLLASYCREFNPALMQADAAYRRLSEACPENEIPWSAFRQAVSEQRLEKFLKESNLSPSPAIQLYAELIDDTPDPLADLHSPVRLFSKFAQLVQDAGLATTYILVDRLDERLLTFRDPQNLASLIAPLVTHLSLMEIPGVKFALFLPREAQEVILPLVRSRSFKSLDLAWENELLLNLLRLRLQVYSKDRVQSLGKLCEDTLARRIETEMIELADGSPRRLLRLGASLFEAHVTISPSEHAITEAAWVQTPAKVFGEQYVRPLRIDRQAAQVYLGQTTPVQLPATPYNLLVYLYEAKGIRSNREISKAVWGDEEWASDEMIRTTVKRVKTALKKAGANADLYIVNEPGRGYKLQNTA
jgi:DNA-binding response OmpR family regulator